VNLRERERRFAVPTPLETTRSASRHLMLENRHSHTIDIGYGRHPGVYAAPKPDMR